MANVLNNPGFENSAANWEGNVGGVSSADAFSGSNSWRVQAGSSAWRVRQGPFLVRAGQVWEAAAWVRSETTDPANALISIHEGGAPSPGATAVAEVNVSGSTAWQHYSVQYEVPPGVSQIWIQLRVLGTAPHTTYFDEALLEDVTPGVNPHAPDMEHVEGALRFTVYDKNFQRKGWVSNPDGAECLIRHNEVGFATFSVPDDDPRVPHLATPGARCVVEYVRGEQTIKLLSGVVREVDGTGGPQADRLFAVTDDKQVLWELLGWPAPTGGIEAQAGRSGRPWRRSGVAETVLKQAVSANASRASVPISVAHNRGRGGNISVAYYMDPLADQLFPAMDEAGLGVTVMQEGAGLVVDVYEKREHTKVLTEESGVIQADESGFTITAPTVTRVIVSDQDEDDGHYLFRQFTRPAWETKWGVCIEQHTTANASEYFSALDDEEATQGEIDDALALFEEDAAQKAAELFAEGAESYSLNLELAETNYFRFGNAVLLGDVVSVQLTGSPVMQDTVTEVEFVDSADDGLTVTPRVGERAEDGASSAFAKAISKLAKGQRKLTSRG